MTVRKFGGKKFVNDSNHRTKQAANREKENIKRHDHYARITHNMNWKKGYTVWMSLQRKQKR